MEPTPIIDDRRDTVRRAVLEWGRDHLRDLPWRRTREPWAVLVSEVMAQQTGVERVVPKWEAFLERWPVPADLAGSELGELLVLWHGLGYPRRARDLHATARVLTEEHAGRVPADLGSLLALPGIGPYTARAVLAFAYEREVGVVDTNVARVLARTSGRRLGAREQQALADAAVPRGRSWLWNQSLMELGATRCRPTPLCERCPVALECAWGSAGRPEPDPAVGSAGVSRRQTPYAGSDREARGRLLAALIDTPLEAGAALAATGVAGDQERARRIVRGVVADGLAVEGADGRLRVP